MLFFSLSDDGQYDLFDIWNQKIKENGEIPKGENPTRDITENKILKREFKLYTSEPKSVYDKARKRVMIDYREKLAKNYNDSEKVQSAECSRIYELEEIDRLQAEATYNFKSKIVNYFKAMHLCREGDEKVLALVCFLALVVFSLLVAWPGIEDIRLNSLKYFVYDFAKCMTDGAFVASLGLLVAFLYNVIKRKKNSRTHLATLVVCLAVGSFNIPFLLNIGTTQIGDYYELTEYKEYYYVEFSREPKSKPNRKVYTLPAEIVRSRDYSGKTPVKEDYYGNEYGGHEIYTSNYHINYLFFSNGGWLYFGDEEDNWVLIDKEVELCDYYDNTYYITLTKEKANMTNFIADKGSE